MFPRLRLKRLITILATVVCFALFLSMYLMMDSMSQTKSEKSYDENDIAILKSRIAELQNDLEINQQTIDAIWKTLQEFSQATGQPNWKDVLKLIPRSSTKQKLGPLRLKGSKAVMNWTHGSVVAPSEMCEVSKSNPSNINVQMLDVFDKLLFDNPDGGVWKQGFPITYDASQWKTEKLKVFVIPHSHCDPGWIKTFNGYYHDQTKHILNNMVEKLEAYPKMKFIYAEISFFSLWWSEIDDVVKEKVKRLLKENRLEIVTGGWVMTDEANAHYFAMLDQMIEGSQWVLDNLGIHPTSGWAIDPFGHSPTMAYLLGKMGLQNMLIQRIHYSVKKHLSQTKQLEFNWRQNWDHSGESDMFCHMMPFYSYDVPHTCGPDPKVCCQFDFKRLPGGQINCPWKIPPAVITDENLPERAQSLLDQYRQKSQLYQHGIVLIPLGDDFRYDKAAEWDQQYNNYQKLFDYMNSKPEWNVEAKFATLSDYFNELRLRSGTSANHLPSGYPTLSGDFFAYADRDDHYWSGYFTSRPFYKRLDRELEAHQRGAEIIFSLALTEARRNKVSSFPEHKLMSHLVESRRSLGLFQHHDGITGTARDFVVADYGQKLLAALKNMKQVIIDSAQFLLTDDKTKYNYSSSPVFIIDEQRTHHDSLPEPVIIDLKEGARQVVFYNSHGHDRVCVVSIHVTDVSVEVRDSSDTVLESQVDPVWYGVSTDDITTTSYRLSFIASVPAMGLSTYTIRSVESNPKNSIAKITIYNSAPTSTSVDKLPFSVDYVGLNASRYSVISIENSEMDVKFSSQTGLIKEVLMKESKDLLSVKVEFVRYGTREGKERSGAYLFLPDGDAKRLYYEDYPKIRVIRGTLVSEVHTSIPLVDHYVKLVNSPVGTDSCAIDVTNLVDIHTEGNTELAMRVVTELVSQENFFYTDLNGFQVQRRKTHGKLPLQANFYPMPTLSYLEDDKHRFSILSGQSLGVASLKPGWLEVMQDRRLDQDDNRGLIQPVHDNKRTPNRFRFLIEQRTSQAAKTSSELFTGYPSMQSHLVSLDLIHPLHALPSTASHYDLLSTYQPLRRPLPCELHLVNLRTFQQPSDQSALILHRLGFDCSIPAKSTTCAFGNGKVDFSDMFNSIRVSNARPSTLLLTNAKEPVTTAEIPEMELRAFMVELR